MCAAKLAMHNVAVIGAGWAGCSAALELANAGCKVTLFESARTVGGRARAVDINGALLDNGQHILLGAYSATLRMLALAGIERDQALLTLPLQMRYPPDGAGMDFVAPRLPAPLHLLVALLRAKGLARADKLALARFSTTARWMGWHLNTDCSVSELLARLDQTERLTTLMWRPLCLAALNTPPERASAQVFLNVLRDSLGARRSASDMLLPRCDLSALFPNKAVELVEAAGGSVRTGAKVSALKQIADGRWQTDVSGAAVGGTWTAYFDGVVLATAPAAAAVLLHDLPGQANANIVAQLTAFESESITTCYLHYPDMTPLGLPFYALVDDGAKGDWGQFVFDRGQLDAAHAGWLAVVISASQQAALMEHGALAHAVAAQLARVLRRPALAKPDKVQVICEKRATFACTPGLARPSNASGNAALVLAGDYTAGDYPATLEGAVRSGVQAAALLRASAHA